MHTYVHNSRMKFEWFVVFGTWLWPCGGRCWGQKSHSGEASSVKQVISVEDNAVVTCKREGRVERRGEKNRGDEQKRQGKLKNKRIDTRKDARKQSEKAYGEERRVMHTVHHWLAQASW